MMQRHHVVCAVGLFVLISFVTPTPAGVGGGSYDGTMESSFGTTFDECIAFQAGGSLCSDGGLNGSFVELDLFLFGFWWADTTSSSGINIDWAGFHLFGLLVTANGTSDENTTFVFSATSGQCACGGGVTVTEDPFAR